MLTFCQQPDVSRDEFLREETLLLAVTHHARIGRQQAPERRGSLLSLVFLPEAQRTVDQVTSHMATPSCGICARKPSRPPTHNSRAIKWVKCARSFRKRGVGSTVWMVLWP